MASREHRSARERRLREKYRRKTAITSIFTLIVGLIAGFVLCVTSVNHPGAMSRLLKIGPLTDNAVTVVADSTPEPTAEATPDNNIDNDAALTFNQPDGDAADLSFLNAGADIDGEEPEDFVPEDDDGSDFFTSDDDSFGDDFGGEEEPATDDDPATLASNNGLQIVAAQVEAEPVEETTPEPTAEPTPEATEAPTPEPQEATAEPTEEPTEEPTAEPTEKPTPEPVEEPDEIEPVIVPYGEAYTLDADITADGTARTDASEASYETLNITLQVNAYKDPTYFQEMYATQYKLQGDEAAIEFTATLNGYTGTTEIIPQNFLLVTLVGSEPDITAQGYQLMDAEIAGKTDVAISTDVPTKLFKRYPYSANQGDMVYLSVTAYTDGVKNVYWFEVLAPQAPAEEAAAEGSAEGEAAEGASGSTAAEGSSDGISLTVGSRGEEVTKLQRVLIRLGLLKGSPDGKFGNYTAQAVKTMQGRYGMEKTDIADQAFLDRLYAENP